MEGVANIKISEAYLPLWFEYYEHYGFWGGRGGAKSHCISEATIGHACKRRERIVCGRQYQNSIRDSVKELLEQKIYKMGMGVYFTSTERELVNVSNGSRFSFIGMHRNPDSAKSLEGCTLFWGEEAQTFTERSVEIIIPTIRAEGSRCIWSWNPRKRTDPVDMLLRGPAPPENSYVVQVGTEDNPYLLRTRMRSEMRRSLRANPKRYHHIWEGGYDENPDLAIFPNWKIEALAVPEGILPVYGLDFGYSQDPTALIKAYIIEELDIIYVAEEAYGHKIPNRLLPDLLDGVNGSRDWPLIGDSSRPETIEFLNSAGFNVFPSVKGPGSIKNGINYLQGFTIVVHPSCVNFIEEIRHYCWAADPQGNALPLPAPHQPDHGIDGLRYAVEEQSRSIFSSDDGVDYL